MAENGKIPAGFCGVQMLVCQGETVEGTILHAANDFKRIAKQQANVAFVRMKVPGIQAEVREMVIPGIEVVAVHDQMLMHHVWVGAR